MHEANRQVYRDELQRLLLARYRLKECARIQKLSYSTVRKYASDPAFLESLKLLSKEVYSEVDEELRLSSESLTSRIEDASARALERLTQLIESSNEGIALKASANILDRNPEVSRTSKLEAEHKVKLDPVFLVHAAATAREVDHYEQTRTRPQPQVVKELPSDASVN